MLRETELRAVGTDHKRVMCYFGTAVAVKANIGISGNWFLNDEILR